MRRRLGNMEAALDITRRFAPMSVAGVVRLQGAPDVDSLRRALDIVQERHPLLRSRITTRRQRPTFEESKSVPPIPLEVHARRDEAHWRDIAERVLNTNVDIENGPLLACTYLQNQGDTQADLVFAFDHTVMDAVSAGRIIDQLLGLCSGTTDRVKPAIAQLPPPIDHMLPDHLTGRARLAPLGQYMRRQAAEEIAYRRGIHGRQAPIHSTASCYILTRSLERDATADLVDQSRSRRLTMNSVIAAALISATHQHLYTGEALPMRAIMFADLRPKLLPPPPAEVMACYLSMLRYTLQVQPDNDLWNIARAFQAQVQRSMTRHEHLLAAGLARQLMRMIIGTKNTRMATTAVSYAGPLTLGERYGDIEVTDVHGFISNNRLGPVATAFVTIFRERLTWNFVFLDTDMDSMIAARIADTTCDKLLEAGSR